MNDYDSISSYLVNKRIISTPAMLVSSALTDAHRPLLSVGRFITNSEIRFASRPNPQQHMIITPSTINFRTLGYSGGKVKSGGSSIPFVLYLRVNVKLFS